MDTGLQLTYWHAYSKILATLATLSILSRPQGLNPERGASRRSDLSGVALRSDSEEGRRRKETPRQRVYLSSF